MSLLNIDPLAEHKFESEGVIFTIRGLTLREKMKIFPGTINDVGEMEIGSQLMVKICELGLIGWNDEVQFDSDNPGINIDKLSITGFSEIVNEIISLSGLGEDAKKK